MDGFGGHERQNAAERKDTSTTEAKLLDENKYVYLKCCFNLCLGAMWVSLSMKA